MVQILAYICSSSFQLDWHAANTHLIAPVQNKIGESQAVYTTHELFSHEEMLDIKGNAQSIQNWS